MKEFIQQVATGASLSQEDMTQAMQTIMSGEASDAQIGGFLMALRVRGETLDEVIAATKVLRNLATRVNVDHPHLVDTCGTGGDGTGTFNISTASAFVAASAGAAVAKHGNRSVSSKSGSADVLEAAGVNLAITPEQVAQCINELGIGFLFAQRHFDAMRHAGGPRRELATRTLFNLLGPMSNPASAQNQVLGVFSKDWVLPMCQTLKALGSNHVLVVHSEDGLDEISLAAPTQVAELNNGNISEYTISPSEFGMESRTLDSLKVADAEESLAMIQAAFSGKHQDATDIIALNAGAAIYVAGLADSHASGVEQAQSLMNDGSAAAKISALATLTQSFAS